MGRGIDGLLTVSTPFGALSLLVDGRLVQGLIGTVTYGNLRYTLDGVISRCRTCEAVQGILTSGQACRATPSDNIAQVFVLGLHATPRVSASGVSRWSSSVLRLTRPSGSDCKAPTVVTCGVVGRFCETTSPGCEMAFTSFVGRHSPNGC